MIPERAAAIPSYVPAQFEDAAPGHRFLMYFAYWEATSFSAYKDAPLPDIKHLKKEERNRIRKKFDAEKKAPLGEVCPLSHSAKATLEGIRRRQQTLLAAYGPDGLRVSATSTAPFATGLGNEHPIENGFAFLTPYGLPYLAGSGVKGVLRRAAEELALFADEYAQRSHPDPLPEAGGESHPTLLATGLTMLDVWWLFGFEGAETRNGPATAIFDPDTRAGRAFAQSLATLATRDDLRDFIRIALADDKKTQAYYLDDKEDRRLAFLQRLLADVTFRQSIHTRGALNCWDVFPVPTNNKLVVEIMTPHHAGYYMNGQTPHDAESPVPVPFLALPAHSVFDFHVVCASHRLPASLRATWRSSLHQIFQVAFDWLGFGAKTAVGYGAMERQIEPEQHAQPKAESTRVAPEDAPERDSQRNQPEAEKWTGARLKFNRANKALTAEKDGKTATAIAPKGEALLATLPVEIRKKVESNQFVKVTAFVSKGRDLIRVE